ncbi:MAG: response regulator [Bryobacterales bacterium]|nr:response regulator [Bryobacterales bacterium]
MKPLLFLTKNQKGSRYARPMRATAVSLARVLLVSGSPTSRLTLQTLLEAGGYWVDSAASAAEAVSKLDDREYELVLSDLHLESPEAGLRVIAHARRVDNHPATALISTHLEDSRAVSGRTLLIEPQDVPELLTKVADLISDRATRRLERELKLAAAGC